MDSKDFNPDSILSNAMKSKAFHTDPSIQGVRKQIFYGGPDQIKKIRFCKISKFLLYKSQKDGGPCPIISTQWS